MRFTSLPYSNPTLTDTIPGTIQKSTAESAAGRNVRSTLEELCRSLQSRNQELEAEMKERLAEEEHRRKQEEQERKKAEEKQKQQSAPKKKRSI